MGPYGDHALEFAICLCRSVLGCRKCMYLLWAGRCGSLQENDVHNKSSKIYQDIINRCIE